MRSDEWNKVNGKGVFHPKSNLASVYTALLQSPNPLGVQL